MRFSPRREAWLVVASRMRAGREIADFRMELRFRNGG